MKKCFIILIPGFPADEADSTCLPFQQQFIRTMQKTYPGLEILVLSFHYPFYQNHYQWHGIRVHSFRGKNRGHVYRWYRNSQINKALEKIRKEKEITGLLSFWYGECAVAGKRFADKYGLRHYCWLMGQDAKTTNPYPKRYRIEQDELIALSDFLRVRLFKDHQILPAKVITPGVRKDLFAGNHTIRDIDLLAVGSLIPLKRFDIFISMISRLQKHIPGIKARLIGSGPEKQKLEQLVKQYGLENNLVLLDEQPHDKVIAHMKRAKVFLHPSAYEGFPSVCLEALAAGAKVVSFFKPMEDTITNWHNVHDEQEMETCLVHLLENNVEYQSFIYKDMEETVQEVAALFEELG